jgi:hypothetical protein
MFHNVEFWLFGSNLNREDCTLVIYLSSPYIDLFEFNSCGEKLLGENAASCIPAIDLFISYKSF